MKRLVLAIQKGGQGKTFATCHLAADFVARGLRVLVVDLDTQANATYTLAEHQTGHMASQLFSEPNQALLKDWFRDQKQNLSVISADADLANLDKVELSKAASALRANMELLDPFFDVCLIDTAPSLGVAMTSAILAADYMLSPVEMEAYSLQGVKRLLTVVSNLRKQNPKLKFLGMLPNKVDGRKPRHANNLAALRQAYPSLVQPCTIGSRDSIAEALGERKLVWDIKKTAARRATAEVRAMAARIYQEMGFGQ